MVFSSFIFDKNIDEQNDFNWYLSAKGNAQEEWKFSRTEMWLEWIDKSNTVPVPFNIFYVVLLCCKRAFSIVLKRCIKVRHGKVRLFPVDTITRINSQFLIMKGVDVEASN